jgi:anti-sigma factor RsiW
MTTPLPKETPNDMAPGCGASARLLGAHLDGQLDAVRTLEIEEHLGACEPCRERLAFDRAVRASLKKTSKAQMSEGARLRMLAAMKTAGEETRVETSEVPQALPAVAAGGDARRERGALRHWRTMLPLASAAAIAIGWGFAGKQPIAPVLHGGSEEVRAGFANDELLRELVAVHSHPLSPERTDPRDVRALERDVGVPVRLPQLKVKGNARFVGGRVLPVRHGSERAAMLQYEIVKDDRIQRVSVFVYDPRRVHVSGPNLAPRAVGTAQVHVGQAAGYSVAVTQRGDVGYAFASDMDPESSATLAADAE